jgi:hypothetical protein
MRRIISDKEMEFVKKIMPYCEYRSGKGIVLKEDAPKEVVQAYNDYLLFIKNDEE